jgi:hypothetical protein
LNDDPAASGVLAVIHGRKSNAFCKENAAPGLTDASFDIDLLRLRAFLYVGSD